MTITLLAAVARNGVIGSNGRLPWHLPGDLQQFKATTMGHPIVMGRKTFDAIGGPLPGRTTIVITRNRDWQPNPEVLVVASPAEALALALSRDDDVYVIGGGEIYRAAIGTADRLLISWLDAAYDGDTTFPDIEPDSWLLVDKKQYDGWSRAEYVRKR